MFPSFITVTQPKEYELDQEQQEKFREISALGYDAFARAFKQQTAPRINEPGSLEHLLIGLRRFRDIIERGHDQPLTISEEEFFSCERPTIKEETSAGEGDAEEGKEPFRELDCRQGREEGCRCTDCHWDSEESWPKL